jgi:hypothetical protein
MVISPQLEHFCAHCEGLFTHERLEEHLKKEECFNIPHYCQNCCTFLPNIQNLEHHLKGCQELPNQIPTPCRFCGQQLLSKMALVAHLYRFHQPSLPLPNYICACESKWCVGFQAHFAKLCMFCGAKFRSDIDLISHLFENHKEENNTPKIVLMNYKCGLCGEICESAETMYDHNLKMACVVKSSFCKFCFFQSVSAEDMFFHLKNQHKMQIFCGSCTFSQSSNLANHIKDTHNFSCDICGISFKKKMYLDEHQKALSCRKCKFCPNVCIKNETELAEHLATHNPNHVTICPVCRKYLKPEDMSAHLEEEKLVKNLISCEFCSSLYFKNEQSKDWHNRFHHVTCDSTCKKTFANYQDFFAHRIRAKLGGDFVDFKCIESKKVHCLHCYQPFETTSDLEKHISAQECMFTAKICMQCRTLIFSAEDYKEHAGKSNSSKIIKCPVCFIHFVNSCQLQSHIFRVHNGKGDFCCKMCTGWCHMVRRHLKEGKDNCIICKSGFSQKSALEVMLHFYDRHSHLKLNQQVICVLCKKIFSNGENYYNHLERCREIRGKFEFTLTPMTRTKFIEIDKMLLIHKQNC